MNYLSDLNEKQREAAEHTEGPLLILAGAGAGKTKTITHRILKIIHSGTSPDKVLAITFTNKAAREMRERVISLIEHDPDLNLPISFSERPFVSTFHSLGVHILRENSDKLGLPRHFTIFDRGDSMRAIRENIKDSGLDPKEWEPGKMLGIISKWKGEGVSLSDYEERSSENFLDRTLLIIWQKYSAQLKKARALDFDDLLLETLKLLRNNNSVREHYNNVWHYIHIDEYQDTNRVQYDIAKMLATPRNNICAVGDIDQSIYSWRGADFKNIMRFEKDYPESKTILLEKNYRSTKKILRAANEIIEKNTLRKEKNLYTDNPEGEDISLFGAYDERGEALFVAEKIQSLLISGVEPREIAVLYRANFQSRILEEMCLFNKIPYEVLGVRFFERKEVKDLLSYVRLSVGNSEESAGDYARIANTPPRGIGKVTLAKILSGQKSELSAKVLSEVNNLEKIFSDIKIAFAEKTFSEAVTFAIERSGLKNYYENDKIEGEERLENIFELVAVAKRYDLLNKEEALLQFLTDAALASDQDDIKENRNNVKLMTVHAAKGLEFDYCFITGLEEDLFPHARPDGGKKNLEENEEERRLFYVALTRARKKLFLSYAAVRTVFGSRTMNVPSSFLNDISEEILINETERGGGFSGKVIYLD